MTLHRLILPAADALTLRSAMNEDHAILEHLFEELLNAFQADAREQINRLWCVFDRRLRAHLELEEEIILPAFSKVDAPEAAALRREHDSIREQLLQLGIGVDLHMIRKPQVEAFLTQLKAHAKREDALLYRYLDKPGDPRMRGQISQRLASH